MLSIGQQHALERKMKKTTQIQNDGTSREIQGCGGGEGSSGDLKRRCYKPKEVGVMLGVSTKSVYRLLSRGLLRANNSLRHKLIGAEELARFVREN